MPDEPFLLVSLEEAKAKKLAQVLNNETCTKILNYLANGKDGTETEISKALKLPLSTVHYNLKQLVEARLVLADEYHYSEKGREVNHYKLANKYIIIAPTQEQSGFAEKLKGFLPVTLITIGTAAILKALGFLNGSYGVRLSSKAGDAAPAALPMPLFAEDIAIAEDAAIAGGEEASRLLMDGALATAPAAGGADLTLRSVANGTPGGEAALFASPQADMAPTEAAQGFFSNELLLAFLLGGLFVILLLILFAYYRHLRERRTR